MASLVFAVQTVLPVFLLILLGMGLKRFRWMDDSFIETGSRMVFGISLPALMVLSVSGMDRQLLLNKHEIFLALGVIIGIFIFCWLLGRLFWKPQDFGVFTQGAFRGNMAIIGLALISQVLGAQGIAKGAVFISLLMPLFNVLATVVLVVPITAEKHEKVHLGKLLFHTLLQLVKNPLLIGVAIGFLLFAFSIPLPPVLKTSLGYLGRLSLPLALICIGGGMDLSHLRENLGKTLGAVGIKVILLPVLAFFLALKLDISPLSRVVIFILMGSPTAVSSYPMARVLGGNPVLAANIVALSTLLSILTIGGGIFLLGIGGYLG